MITRERALELANEGSALHGLIVEQLKSHAAAAVAERDAMWREAVQAIGDEYGVLKYRILDKIFAEVERRKKGGLPLTAGG